MDTSTVNTLIQSGITGGIALLGILVSSKLTLYRLEQLEKKVDKHNNLIERMYKVEKDIAIIQEEIKNWDDIYERKSVSR